MPILRTLLLTTMLLGGTVPCGLPARAQLVRQPSASAARGGPVAELQQMPAFANPASIAGWTGRAVALHVGRPYHLPSLHAVALHLASGGAAQSAEVALTRFGYDRYVETGAHAVIARRVRIADHALFSWGTRIRLVHAAAAGYSALTAWSLDLGWVASFADGLQLGSVIRALANGGTPSLRPAAEVAFGGSIHLGGGARLSGQLRRESGFGPGTGLGVEIPTTERVLVRVGVQSEPLQFCTGLGVEIGHLRADLAAVSHPVLGWSSSVTIVVQQRSRP